MSHENWEGLIHGWFVAADVDKDGRIAGNEAVAFFHRAELPEETLSQAWRHTKSCSANPSANGLDASDFALYLRIVAYVQRGHSVPSAFSLATSRGPAIHPAPFLRGLTGRIPAAMAPAGASPAATPHPSGFAPRLHPSTAPPDPSPEPASSSASAASARHVPPRGIPAPVSVPEEALSPRSGPNSQEGPQDWGARTARTLSSTRALTRRLVSSGDGPSVSTGTVIYVSEEAPAKPYSPMLPAHAVLRPPYSERVTRACIQMHGKEAQLTAMAACEGCVVVGTAAAPTLTVFSGLSSATGAATPPPDVPRPPVADPDCAPCAHLVPPAAVLAMDADPAHGVIWMGHEGGKVSSWACDPVMGTVSMLRMWDAFKNGGVCTVCVVDPEGTRVLTGSTWGELKLWAAPIGGQPLHLPSSDPPLGLDLRLPYGAQPHDVVRTMAVPRCGGVAWSGGKHNVAIWDATTGAFLGTISQAENPPSHAIDVSAGLTMDSFGRVVVHLTPGHDARETQASDKFGDLKAAKAKMFSFGKKVIKRTKEAFRGSASAVTGQSRPATPLGKYQLGELGALEAVGPEHVWAGYRSGTVQVFTAAGQLVGTAAVACKNMTALKEVAGRVWVGHSDGTMRVLDYEGAQIASFPAHGSPVMAIAQMGPLAVTSAFDGCVAVWPSLLDCTGAAAETDSPPAAVPDMDLLQISDTPRQPATPKTAPCMEEERARRMREADAQWRDAVKERCMQLAEFTVVAGTWNVAEKKPDLGDLQAWLGPRTQQADMVVAGLQETQMGGGSVALSTAKEMLKTKGGEQGTLVAQEWAAAVHDALDRATQGPWVRVALRQMGGIVLAVFIRHQWFPLLSRVETAAVGVGVMGVGANKGAVAIRFEVLRRTVCCICAHLSAHQSQWDRRNQDFATIVSSLRFKHVLGIGCGAATALNAAVAQGHADAPIDEAEEELPGRWGQGEGAPAGVPGEERGKKQGLLDADLVVWVGDLNYRVDVAYEEALEMVQAGDLSRLAANDQLRVQMTAGNVFQGFKEGHVAFPPTYKFDKGVPGPAYDSSEKRRVPAWTDRVLWFCPPADPTIAVRVQCQSYGSVPEVLTSDHKPVYASLSLSVPHVSLRDQLAAFAASTRRLWELAQGPPSLVVAPPSISLTAAAEGRALQIRNTGAQSVYFTAELVDDSRTRPQGMEGASPRDWLATWPESGVVGAGEETLVAVEYIGRPHGTRRSCRVRITAFHELSCGLPRRQHAQVLDVPVSEPGPGAAGPSSHAPPPSYDQVATQGPNARGPPPYSQAAGPSPSPLPPSYSQAAGPSPSLLPPAYSQAARPPSSPLPPASSTPVHFRYPGAISPNGESRSALLASQRSEPAEGGIQVGHAPYAPFAPSPAGSISRGRERGPRLQGVATVPGTDRQDESGSRGGWDGPDLLSL